LLFGDPHVHRPHASGAAPDGATQRQAASIAAADISGPLYKSKASEHHAGVEGALKAVFYRTEIRLALRLVFDFDVRAVQRNVAPDKLDLTDAMISR
jgi:hypothetical protein